MKPHHENAPCSTNVGDVQASQSESKLKLSIIEDKFGPDAALAARDYADLLVSLHNRELAHQIRTTLTSLIGASARISAANNTDKNFCSDASEAEQAVNSLRTLVREVEAFSSPLHLTIKPASVMSLVKESYALANDISLETVDTATSMKLTFLNGDDVEVNASKSHVVRAIANIMQTLVETSNADNVSVTENPIVIIQVKTIDEFVCINIAKGGVTEISDNISTRLPYDDPDFGVLVASRIIELHGGEMELRNESGMTVSAIIKFPRFV